VTGSQASDTKYPPIRWGDNGHNSGVLGWVGANSEWFFQIWRPSAERQWELICNLPGSRSTAYDKDMDKLKDDAQRWLKWFIDDMNNPRPSL
jgi:hypothetical protein